MDMALIQDTSNFAALQAQIYAHYGLHKIGRPYDFPDPLFPAESPISRECEINETIQNNLLSTV